MLETWSSGRKVLADIIALTKLNIKSMVLNVKYN